MMCLNRSCFVLCTGAFVLVGCGGSQTLTGEPRSASSLQKVGRIAQRLSSSFSVLYAFKGGAYADGSGPAASLIMDKSGALYGTTDEGGTSGPTLCQGPHHTTSGCGTVFTLTPSGSTYTESVPHRFCVKPDCADGRVPLDALIHHKNDLYGTTAQGGAYDSGTAFKLTPSKSRYTEHVLHSFGGSGDGAIPLAGLTLGANGVLYGTTSAGGAAGFGTVFELTPSGSGYSEHVVHSFGGSPDGANPNAGVILSGNGVLYGTTVNGGLGSCSYGSKPGCGTVFSISATNKEKVLYRFKGETSSDGAFPYGGVILAKKGTLYGTTVGGGAYRSGTVYTLTRASSGYSEHLLYSFGVTSNDGAGPYAGVILAQNGSLYGRRLLAAESIAHLVGAPLQAHAAPSSS
jgi:uncharacterized repeat protein (TIGR03803 family)